MTLSTPSMPSAMAHVTSSDSSSRSSARSGRMNTSCSATPSAKLSGATIEDPDEGIDVQLREEL